MSGSEATRARILIVDDHPIVRQGMALLINREADLHVCCEASDGEQALAMSAACRHDLAIVDLSLAGITGLDLIKQLQHRFPNLAVLIMSMHDETVYAERALRAGAHGYLMKQEATSTILTAIRLILRGERYVSDRMRSRLLEQRVHGASEVSPIAGLTAAEFEVLHLIGMGLGTSEIGEKLRRSVKTIESHRANIKRKLKLASGNELVLFSINWVNGNRMAPIPQPNGKP